MAKTFSLDFLLLIALTIINLRLISTAASPPPLALTPPPPPPSPPAAILTRPPHSTPIIPPTPHSPPPIIPPPPSRLIMPPSPTAPPPPQPQGTLSDRQEEQLNNIINALMGSGDFAGWAEILSAADPSALPITATLFIPGNDAISHLPTATSATINFDPFLIPYHIIPQRLSFSDLHLFNTQSRLPTLLPSKTILITNNSLSNFTIDNSRITHPDIYLTSAISVHGINNILDYTLYGDNFFPPEQIAVPPLAVAPPFFPAGEVMGARKSDAAACLCTEFPIFFSVLCAAFAFKILQNPLNSLMGLFTR